MKLTLVLLAALCVVTLAVLPAGAVSIRALTITIAPNGDATVDLQYSLTLLEQTAVYFQLADPAAELKQGLESNLGRQVTVLGVSPASAEVIIPSFASVSESQGSMTVTTPGFSLAQAQHDIDRYWFAPLISPDFTPQVTTIVFPDGTSETVYNEIDIPSFTHRIG